MHITDLKKQSIRAALGLHNLANACTSRLVMRDEIKHKVLKMMKNETRKILIPGCRANDNLRIGLT